MLSNTIQTYTENSFFFSINHESHNALESPCLRYVKSITQQS